MVLSLDRWVDKVAVVTGASSGIGTSISKYLVENGLQVVGLARRSEKVEELAQQLSGKKGRLYAVKADVTKEQEVQDAFKWISENLGPVHVLVNNAGVSKETSLYNGNFEDWKNVLDVNVLGVCVATKEAVRSMTTNNINGHIIYINSVFGHKVYDFPNANLYPASKYAVTALVETLRHEFNRIGAKIKITSLSPGLVETEMTTLNRNFTEERQEAFRKMAILKGEDIAEAVGYVLSTPEHVQINELTITPVGERWQIN